LFIGLANAAVLAGESGVVTKQASAPI